jgi:hypothetical protein
MIMKRRLAFILPSLALVPSATASACTVFDGLQSR